MAKKIQRGLGRGLGALLGDVVDEPMESTDSIISESAELASLAPLTPEPEEPREPVDEVRLIPIGQIDPNLEQPRQSFNENALKELADSIRAVGIIQPIIVKPEGERFTIIAGERRYRACRIAEFTEIPAIVRDWDQQKRLEAALVENIQRDNLNPVEEATGVRRLMEEAGLTQEMIAQRLGKSRPAVANLLRLLTLPEAVLQMLREGKLTAGHARALVTVDPKRQVQLANLAVQQGWSVRQLERICAQPVKEGVKSLQPPRDSQIAQLEGMARELFGTRVKLEGTTENGKITLFYYNGDDLQRIWDVMETARGGR